MRRDFEGDAPAAREDERGIAESSEPAMRGSLDPLDTPRQVSERQVVERPFLERPAPERPRVERPLPQTRRPARPIESARAQRPVQRARREPARQPAPTPERHFTELVHFESTPFRGIERLESVEFEQLHGLDPYAIPERVAIRPLRRRYSV
jgi:hypothetical protein